MQRGSAQLFLIIFIVTLIAASGFYFYQNSKTNNSLQVPRLALTKKQELPTVKDYSNQLGFELKYPTELIIKEDTEEEFNKRDGGDFRKNFKGYVQYEPGKFLGAVVVLGKDNNFDTNLFTLWVFDNPQDLSIDAWYKNYWYYPFVWGDFTYKGKVELAPKQEATISGQISKSGIIDYSPGKPKFVYINYKGKMYLFRIIGEVGDQILNTFKFL